MTPRIYARVSSVQQVENFSLAAQFDRLKAYCRFQNWPEAIEYQDAGISGKRDDRPGLEAMLSSLQSGDVVCAVSLSRLGRGGAGQVLRIVDRIRSAGARLVLVNEGVDTETPVGRLMLTVLAGLAELELEYMRDRMTSGVEQALKEGVWPAGEPPYGYTRTEAGTLEIHIQQAHTVRRMYHHASTHSLKGIEHALANEGIRTTHKKRWVAPMIHRIITNPIYKGDGFFRWYFRRSAPQQMIPFHVNPIVTPDEWDAAQRTPSTKNAHAKPDTYPLTGHLECGCGAALMGRTKILSGRTRKDYICMEPVRKQRKCTFTQKVLPSFTADPLEHEARELLASAFENPSDPLALHALYARSTTPDPQANERAGVQAQIENLLDMRQHGEISRDKLKRRRAPLDQRLKELKASTPPPPDMPDMREAATAIRTSSNLQFSKLLDATRAVFRLTHKGLKLVSYQPFNGMDQVNA